MTKKTDAGSGTSAPTGTPNRQAIEGIGFSLASGMSFQGMNASIRMISGELHSFEIVFFRNFFGLLALGPLLIREGRSAFRTTRMPLHLLRVFFNLIAMFAAITAIATVPLVKFTALYFAAPLFATIGAVIFLGERIHGRRVAALIAGFIGALIILRPEFGDMSTGSMLTLLSAAAWACALLVIKALSKTESSLTTTVWATTMLVPCSLVAALFFWRWPEGQQWLWLILIGVFGSAAQLALAQAFRKADATLVLSVDFTKLIWASIVGYLFFHEVPGTWTWIGGLVLFGSVTYIAHRERLARGNGAP